MFGNVDRVGDVVVPGAFTKTLEEDFSRIRVQRNHESVIGKPVHAEQDSTGLLTVSRISPTPLGDETLALIQDGVVDAMSIGYYAEQKSFKDNGSRRIRNLEQIRLTEWSLLDITPVNPLAAILSVKSLSDVSYCLYQMQETLRALQTLSYTPPEIAQRLAALMSDVEQLAADADPDDTGSAKDQAQAAALAQLLSTFSAGLKASAA